MRAPPSTAPPEFEQPRSGDGTPNEFLEADGRRPLVRADPPGYSFPPDGPVAQPRACERPETGFAPGEKRAAAPALRLRVRRGGRRRVLATLLWAMGLYAVVQWCLLATWDRWLPMEFRGNRREKERRLAELATEYPGRPLLVMFGSSRTERGFQAGRLNGLCGPGGEAFVAYNFGIPATGAIFMNAFVREMLDKGIRPRLVLLEDVRPFSHAPEGDLVSEEHWTPAGWMTAGQLVRLSSYFQDPQSKVSDWVHARIAPGWSFRREIRAWLKDRIRPGKTPPPELPYDPWGYRKTPYFKDSDRIVLGRSTYKMYHDTLASLHLSEGPTHAMRDLVALCSREGLPVVLVKMPESTTFHGWYNAEALAESQAFLDGLRQEFGVHVIDAENWVADDGFSDLNHLTDEGARVFSDRLRAELEERFAGAGRRAAAPALPGAAVR